VRGRRGLIGLAAAVVIAGLVATGYVWGARARDDTGARQAEIARRGETVMPFDLEATTHVFEKDRDGGVQTVVADDPGDVEQVRLVREHLREEAEAFRAGDYGDPAAIHGMEMPGLATLEARADEIEIRYEDVPEGGRIRYTTEAPALVSALHAWFDAQVMDHGAHAREES
jgi:hypothetical protein